MPIKQTFAVMSSHIIDKGNSLSVIMTHITQEEEELLDAKKEIIINRGDRTFVLDQSNLYCYGSIEFNNNSKDLDTIEQFPFLDYLGPVGIRIPSDYDYNTHTCRSPINSYRTTETWNPVDVCQYAHGYLGKPEKVAIFIYR